MNPVITCCACSDPTICKILIITQFCYNTDFTVDLKNSVIIRFQYIYISWILWIWEEFGLNYILYVIIGKLGDQMNLYAKYGTSKSFAIMDPVETICKLWNQLKVFTNYRTSWKYLQTIEPVETICKLWNQLKRFANYGTSWKDL